VTLELDPLVELQLALDVAAVPELNLDPRLHGYQVEGVRHLHEHPRSALFMIPGLGKTAITLNALTPVHLPALVIAPKRVIEETWPAELEMWRPDLSYSLIRGGPAVRQERLAEDTDVHLITWDTLAGDLRKKSQSEKYQTVVIDELSKAKNRSSKRWKAVKRITHLTPYIWGLTGTPMPNGLLDLWGQLYLLDKGARLETTLTNYRRKYFNAGARLPNGVITEWKLRDQADEVIQNRIADICLSVAQHHVKYPAKLDTYHRFRMPPKCYKRYAELLEHFVTMIEEEQVSVANAAARTTKLRQLASGFLYHSGLIGVIDEHVDQTTQLHYNKIEIVKELLDDAQGAPALVFYGFEEDQRRLMELPGAVDIRDKGAIKRWNEKEIPVLVAHPASAGHGLNLQHGGNLMIWYSLTWSSEEYVQGVGRLVRQGQPSPAVAVHHLIAEDTVEEQMLDVVTGKISRQDALLSVLTREN
jgi:SNF2 family DNA or RNA helicase